MNNFLTKVIPAVQVSAQLLHDLSSDDHDGVAEKEAQVPHPALPHPYSGKETPQKNQIETTSTFSDPLPCDWSDCGRGGEFSCSGAKIDNHIAGDNDVVHHGDHDDVVEHGDLDGAEHGDLDDDKVSVVGW